MSNRYTVKREKSINGHHNSGKRVQSGVKRYTYPRKPSAQPHYLEREELAEIVGFLKKGDPGLYRTMQQYPRTIWIAGGFIRSFLNGETICDIDVFGCDLMYMGMAIEACRAETKAAMKKTRYTITMDGAIAPVQFITSAVYPNARHCIDLFDFTVCQAAIWYQGGRWHSACSEYFHQDLEKKRLRYTSPNRVDENPIAWLYRVKRYVDKGYFLPDEDRLKLLERFFRSNPSELECGERDFYPPSLFGKAVAYASSHWKGVQDDYVL